MKGHLQLPNNAVVGYLALDGIQANASWCDRGIRTCQEDAVRVGQHPGMSATAPAATGYKHGNTSFLTIRPAAGKESRPQVLPVPQRPGWSWPGPVGPGEGSASAVSCRQQQQQTIDCRKRSTPSTSGIAVFLWLTWLGQLTTVSSMGDVAVKPSMPRLLGRRQTAGGLLLFSLLVLMQMSQLPTCYSSTHIR